MLYARTLSLTYQEGRPIRAGFSIMTGAAKDLESRGDLLV
jgi:hypothetical protein